MTEQEISAIVERQLAAEALYLEAAVSFPGIRAERRRILEEAERELAAALAEILRVDVCTASGRPAGLSGNPDGRDKTGTIGAP